jgi:hypothetical protein
VLRWWTCCTPTQRRPASSSRKGSHCRLSAPYAKGSLGKPEPLKGDLSGYWSRRIDDEHRLVYRADDKEVKILKARYHYTD